MLRVGLTGGIGSGKSTVAARLVEHGAVVIDSDAIAREVVEPGTEALAELVEAFGDDILTPEGVLNRPGLAAKAFSDDASRERLNRIVHPRIAARTAERQAAAPFDAIVVHDVPLLIEARSSAGFHIVLNVDAPVETRVRRLVESRGMGEADARARMATQAQEPERRAAADVWLDNAGTSDIVLAQVDRLWADRLVPFEANIRLRRPRASRSPKIVPYDDTWPAQAERALGRVRLAVGDRALRADHIGSTSVPGLPAKDTLDLQLTMPTLDTADELADALSDAGFVRTPGEWWDDPQDGDVPWPKRFHYGADPGRPINLHVRSPQTPAWRLALLFPAWLRENPDERDAYADVKRKLADAHASDGSGESYATEKQEWVNAAFRRAEDWAQRTGWTP